MCHLSSYNVNVKGKAVNILRNFLKNLVIKDLVKRIIGDQAPGGQHVIVTLPPEQHVIVHHSGDRRSVDTTRHGTMTMSALTATMLMASESWCPSKSNKWYNFPFNQFLMVATKRPIEMINFSNNVCK